MRSHLLWEAGKWKAEEISLLQLPPQVFTFKGASFRQSKADSEGRTPGLTWKAHCLGQGSSSQAYLQLDSLASDQPVHPKGQHCLPIVVPLHCS